MRRAAYAIVCLAFFLSGLAALLYETLWVRLLALFCGNTTLAISAVLAAFMGGLALGSWAGGKIADRTGSGLLLYARLEAAIALWGLLSKPAIGLVQRFVLSLDLVSAAPAVQSGVYFAAALLVLLVPTTLMGATLPVLTRWAGESLSRGRTRGGDRQATPDRPLGLLYGLNTLGAVCGAAAAGFFLIPAWGLTRSLLLAGSLNALSAVLARAAWSPSEKASPARGAGGEVAWGPSVALFAAGAAGMACQIAWTRAFALELGSSTYSFTTILVTFLAGLSAGGLAFSALRGASKPSLAGLGVLLNAAGLLVLAGMPLFNRLPYAVMRLLAFTAPGGWRLHGARLGLCALVTGLPTALAGAALPWGVAAARPRKEELGRSAGGCYAANTLGAILGSVLAGLVLMPAWGAEGTLALAAGLYGAGGLWAGLAGGARRRRPANVSGTGALRRRLALGLGQALFLAAVGWARPRWDPRVLSSGMFLYGRLYADDRGYPAFLEDLRRDRVVFHKDGRVSTVAVLESPAGERYLRINGKTDASSGGDLDTQLLVGYLPLLLHPKAPRRGLVIGFGAGASAAAMASDKSLEALDLVEIEPAVLEAAPYFKEANRDVLADARVRVHRADGRQFLASPGPRYDLIGSEPSNPWISGVASLYTVEAFESVKARLEEDGVFLQWFHSYLMGADDFKLIMRTFSSVFPHTMLLWTGEADFFLVGSKSPWRIPFAGVKKAFAENPWLRRDMAGAGKGLDDPLALLVSTFLLSDSEVRAMAGPGPLHFDDLPVLEFSAPLHLRGGDMEAILAGIVAVKRGALPEGLEGFSAGAREKSLLYAISAERLLDSGSAAEAAKVLRRAQELWLHSARVQADLGKVAERLGREEEARRLYRKAVSLDPSYAPARLRLGVLEVLRHRDEEGARELEKGLALLPGDPEGSLYLAVAYLEKGRVPEALGLLRAALARPIADPQVHDNLLQALAIAQQQKGR